MALWKLSPLDLAHRDWGASTYKSSVIIRAASEEEARCVAVLAFVIATRKRLGEDVEFCPWDQTDHVRAERVQDQRWPDEGEVTILDPPEYDYELDRTHFRRS